MDIFYNMDITRMNTFRMKVKTACLVQYYSVEELDEISRMDKLPRPFFHIGGGSNLLFLKDFPGTILHSNIKFIQASPPVGGGVAARVGAAVPWDDFCDWCAKRDLWGPENLSMIPGETGAAAVQNIGAYGREIGEIVSTVECYDMAAHKMVAFNRSECSYAYRDSFFKHEGKGRYIVTAVSFALKTDYSPMIEYGDLKDRLIRRHGRFVVFEKGLTPDIVRHAVKDVRNEKLPSVAETGNAGSFFRNPYVTMETYNKIKSMGYSSVPHFENPDGSVKIPAAWLIDQCGWKGYTEGNAGVWPSQPLVLVNASGNASPEEIKSLEDKIKASVRGKFGVELIPEVEHIPETEQ